MGSSLVREVGQRDSTAPPAKKNKRFPFAYDPTPIPFDLGNTTVPSLLSRHLMILSEEDQDERQVRETQ